MKNSKKQVGKKKRRRMWVVLTKPIQLMFHLFHNQQDEGKQPVASKGMGCIILDVSRSSSTKLSSVFSKLWWGNQGLPNRRRVVGSSDVLLLVQVLVCGLQFSNNTRIFTSLLLLALQKQIIHQTVVALIQN